MLCQKYGKESEIIRNVDGIGWGVNQGEWIVTYSNGRYPDQIMKEGGEIKLQDGNAYIQDARDYILEIKAPEKVTEKELSFRI